MSIIQAYKSDADGKLFEDKKKYQLHLRKLASERNAKRKVEKMELEREAFLIQMGQVKSIDELNRFIKDNWKWFWANGAHREHFGWGRKGSPDLHEYVDVTICDVRWSESVSNSHSSPRKGVQNFDTHSEYNKGKPTGYPGWSGRINIKVKPPLRKYQGKDYLSDGYGSSYFERTIVNTGSGGGGGNHKNEYISYSYDIKLFAADFPAMYEQVRREQWVHNQNQERVHIWRSVGGKGLPQSVTEADIPSDFAMSDPLEGDFSRTKW